jgi:hypothetical protein
MEQKKEPKEEENLNRKSDKLAHEIPWAENFTGYMSIVRKSTNIYVKSRSRRNEKFITQEERILKTS